MAFVNLLLNALSKSALDLVAPALERVPLKIRDNLVAAGGQSNWVFFVEDGLISLMSRYQPGHPIEIAMVGREGLFDIGLALGDDEAAFDGNVQVEGSAYRLPRHVFRQLLNSDLASNALVLKFARAFDLQIASTVAASGSAKLEERLARWLLMVHDRVHGNLIHITHDILAQMLCCRRASVTVALHLLEGRGIIASSRGQIEIRDREGLIVEADGCYGRAEAHYARLFGKDLRGRRI